MRDDAGPEPADASIDAQMAALDAPLPVDAGTEICNGEDDDADTRIDEGEGRECRAGAVEVCSTECGTGGFRRCDSACMWERGGGCYADAEVCNYCDDDGDGSIDDERGLATATRAIVDECTGAWRFVSRPPGMVFTPVPCERTSRELLVDGTTSDAAAVWRTEAVQLAHGGMRVTARIRLSKAGTTTPGEGWAIVLGDGGSGDIGDAGGALGVPYTRTGISVEWRFSGADGATDARDRVSVRRLTGADAGRVLRDAEVPVSADWSMAGSSLQQELVVEYTPENPGTIAVEERLLVRAAGVAIIDLTPCPPGGMCVTTVRDEIAHRALVDVGITASTGLRSTSLGFFEGGAMGTTVDLLSVCP